MIVGIAAWAWAGCTADQDSGAAPAKLTEGTQVVCANPSLRAELPFDPVDLPGEKVPPEPAGDVGQYDGGGIAAADFDGDGFLDLLLPNTDADQLFLGEEGGTFANADDHLPTVANAADRTVGATPADVDGDGDLDVFLANLGGGNEIWLNEGGTFTEFASGVEAAGLHSVAGSFGDVDGDGDLDLFVVNHYEGPELGSALFSGDFPIGHPDELWRNDGDGTFTDISDLLPAELLGPAFSLASAWVDTDGDDRPELYVVNDFGPYTVPNRLVGFDSGAGVAADVALGLDASIFGMGVAVGDLNGDGVPDFALSSWNQLMLLESSESGWYDAAVASGFVPEGDDRQVAWGLVFADLDNDGDLDAPVSFGQLQMPDDAREQLDSLSLYDPIEQRDALMIQDETGQFADEAEAWGVADDGTQRGVLAVDLDRDGWLDLVKRDALGPSSVYHARCGENHWIEVGFSSAMVGGWVEIASASGTQRRFIGAGSEGFASGGPPEAHFGLGADTAADLLVHWPDGREDAFEAVNSDRRMVIGRE